MGSLKEWQRSQNLSKSLPVTTVQFTNVNQLIAYLRDIRDEHSLDLPVRFFIDGSSKIELSNVSLKVITTQEYAEESFGSTKTELIISLS